MAIAKTAPKTKTFLHKEVVFSKEVGIGFDDLLKSALKKKSTVVSRMQEGENAGEKRFINYHLLHGSDFGQIYGCEFIGFETGADQSIIDLASGSDVLNVNAIPAGKDKEFLGGSVYFCARGNHVVLFQSVGLRTMELESYLNWLLREASAQIDSETTLTLQDHISRKKRKSLKGVKGIRLTSPLAVGARVKAPGNEADSSGEMTVIPTGGFWEALKNMLGESVELPATFQGKRITELNELEVQLYLKWKGTHKEDGNDFLDSIATQLRHVTDEMDFEIDAKHGKLSKGKLKLSQPFSIPWTDSGRPKFEALFPKMAAWLDALAKDGSIDV